MEAQVSKGCNKVLQINVPLLLLDVLLDKFEKGQVVGA